MAFSRVCVAIAVLSLYAEAVTPIEKVLKLLDDLKTDVEAKGKAEATTYEKFSCFCKDTTKTKSDSIVEGQDTVDVTTADIGKKTTEREEKITKRTEEKQKIETTTLKLQEATEAYKKDKANFDATYADLTKAMTSARKAVDALSAKKGAAFLDLGGARSDVQNCLDLAGALNMVSPSTQEAAASFMQVDPNDPAYKFHSDKILKIIGDLRDDFSKQRDEVDTEWKKTKASYESEKKGMEDKITTAEGEVETLSGDIDTLKEGIAKLKTTLINTETTLKDDSDYLRDLTLRCQDSGEAWDQRSKQRTDEVEALTKAIDVLNKGAKDNADAMKRAALLTAKKPVAAPTQAAVVKAPVKLVSFLQAHTTSQRMKEVVIANLRRASAELKSDMLSSMADKVAKDPFVKIKKLIQGLIESLLEQSKNEATKKGMCDTELGKARSERKTQLASVNKLDADIASLTASKNSLTQEIGDLEVDIESLDKALKEAVELRGEEKAENETTLKQAKEGAEAVGEALVTLKDFYGKAAKASFIQVHASPVDEDTEGAGFDSAYKGDQDSSKAILGLLEVIKSDFERTTSKTEAAEAEAHANFIKFDRASKADIAGKTKKKLLDTQDLATTKSAIDTGMEDLKTAQNLVDAQLKVIEDLKPTCIDTGMSYSERVAKREAEIGALQTALCQLDPDKKEAECQ
jgi:chromosome segregation ATPase